MSSKIPSADFYGSIFSKFVRIARRTLRINDFIPRASDLFSRIAQGGNRATLTKQLEKAFHPYLTVFQLFGKIHEEINTNIMKNT